MESNQGFFSVAHWKKGGFLLDGPIKMVVPELPIKNGGWTSREYTYMYIYSGSPSRWWKKTEIWSSKIGIVYYLDSRLDFQGMSAMSVITPINLLKINA